MATPEQNTLLALQLFGQPAEQFNQQNDKKTALLLRIAELNRAERLGREQQDTQYKRAVDLTNLQTDRALQVEDVRYDRTLAGYQAQADRADQLAKNQEQRIIQAEFSKAYPVYVQAATALKQDIKPITAFEMTPAGLGELQAQMAALKEVANTKDLEAAAVPITGALDLGIGQLRDAQAALKATTQDTQQDIGTAKEIALQNLKGKRETGELADIPEAAWKKGIAELSKEKPDVTIAWGFLGDNARSTYDLGFSAGLQHSRSSKDKLAQIAAAKAGVTGASRGVEQLLTGATAAAARNPKLGAAMAPYFQQYRQLQSQPVADQQTQTDADRLAALRPAGATATAIAPTDQTFGSPALLAARSSSAQGNYASAQQRLRDIIGNISNLETQAKSPPVDAGPFTSFSTNAKPASVLGSLRSLYPQQQQARTDVERLRAILNSLGLSQPAGSSTPIITPAPNTLQPNGAPAGLQYLQDFGGGF